MADMTTTFLIEEDEEPMTTERINLSSDESGYSTRNTTPDHQLECIYPNSINQLIASQLEQRLNTGTETVFYPPTPNMSMISGDEYQMNPTPIIGNPEQYTPQIPPRRNHPIQLCQHVQPIPDTPESPTPENHGHSDKICPDDIPNQTSSIPPNNPPNIMTVADGLRNLTLHPHPQSNEWVTGCLVCGKSYDQVIEETVADYLDQTARNTRNTRKKRQSNRRLLSQLDDFDQDMIIGNAASERQEGIVVNEGNNDRDFTTSTSSNNSAVNGNAVNVKTLERCFNERIDREMSNIVDTVEDRLQNAILSAIDNIIAPKIELAIRSINASSGRDATSVSANSERREHVGINTSFENASENNDTLGVSNVIDETRHNISDEVNGLPVPETHFDRQLHTHHRR